jgi:hypothetical protein
MGLPGVKINVLNGQLGRVALTDDSVMGLIGAGVAVVEGIQLSEPRQIFALKDAEDLGIDEAYDTENEVNIWKQIRDFYAVAGTGAELWIMIVSNATLMADIVDNTGAVAPALLDAAEGRIRMLGVTMDHDTNYEAAYTNGFDDDAYAAAVAAQNLVNDYAARNIPIRVLVEGRDFQGDPTTLTDLREGSQNGVGVVLDGLEAESIAAAVGRALGKFASIPVQRNIGRVKDGDLNIPNAYLSDGNPLEDLSEGQWGAIHDKGFIFLRKFNGRSGYYYNDDPAATVITDDYSALARGRVIDKAHRIAYTTYVGEILDDLEVDPDSGQLNPAVIKSYQALIENAIEANMLNTQEISGVSVRIDPAQDVLSTDKVQLKLNIIPKGYGKNIEVDLGFENPAQA